MSGKRLFVTLRVCACEGYPVGTVGRSEVPTQRDRPTQSASMHASLRRALRRVSCLTETKIRLSARLSESVFGLTEANFCLSETDIRLTEPDFSLSETDFSLSETDFSLSETDFRLTVTDFSLSESDFSLSEPVTGMMV